MKNLFKITNIIIFLIIAIIIALMVFVFKTIKVQDKLVEVFYKKEYNEYVEKYAKQYNVDENFIYAIIRNESKFNSDAVSSSNAKGLMQIMDNTVKDIVRGIDDLEFESLNIFDPETNIHLGVNYLSELLEKYDGKYELAVAAYNAGIGNLDNWIERRYY